MASAITPALHESIARELPDVSWAQDATSVLRDGVRLPHGLGNENTRAQFQFELRKITHALENSALCHGVRAAYANIETCWRNESRWIACEHHSSVYADGTAGASSVSHGTTDGKHNNGLLGYLSRGKTPINEHFVSPLHSSEGVAQGGAPPIRAYGRTCLSRDAPTVLEMICVQKLWAELLEYWFENCNGLFHRFVYFSPTSGGKNRSICGFEEVFAALCMCRHVLGMWNVVRLVCCGAKACMPHENELVACGQHFRFATAARVCVEHVPISQYTVKDVVCGIQCFADAWLRIDYSGYAERYVHLLLWRVADIVARAHPVRVHNMPCYRRGIGAGGEHELYVCDQSFLMFAGTYLYAQLKEFRRLRMFNVVTLYDLDTVFSSTRSARTLSFFSVRTSTHAASDRRDDYAQHPTNYGASLYRARVYTIAQTAESSARNIRAVHRTHDGQNGNAAIDVIRGTVRNTGATTIAATAAAGEGTVSISAAPPGHTTRGQRRSPAADLVVGTQDRCLARRVAAFDEFHMPLLQRRVPFSLRSFWHTQQCLFVYDELLKFYSNPAIAHGVLVWFGAKCAVLQKYGESTGRRLRKMRVNYTVARGEDMLFMRRVPHTTGEVNEVLRKMRGLTAFNHVQEALDVDMRSIFPRHVATAPHAEENSGALHTHKLAQIGRLHARVAASPCACAWRRPWDAATRVHGSTHSDDDDDDDDDGGGGGGSENLCDSGSGNECADSAAAGRRARHEWRRSETAAHIPDAFERGNCAYQRTRLTIEKQLLAICIVDSHFLNFHNMSFQKNFVVYEREIDTRHADVVRARFPMLVQLFGQFQVFYAGNVYYTGNFMASLHLWMRIVQRFHACTVHGKNIELFYTELFGSGERFMRYYKSTLAGILCDPNTDTCPPECDAVVQKDALAPTHRNGAANGAGRTQKRIPICL